MPATFAVQAQRYFVPLANSINALFQQGQRTIFIGVNGCQGSGKSTLTTFLKAYLTEECGLNVANLSLDDFYLNKATRLKLSQGIHPLFITRGVPGTHDTIHLADVLKSLKRGISTLLPYFDKSTDNPAPKEQWQRCEQQTDVVLVEGWCWGVPPQPALALIGSVNALEQQSDQSGHWRHYVNQQLVQHYQPLYAYMDKWIMLQAPNFDCVFDWRWQQEQHLKRHAFGDENAIMNKQELAYFIEHFQRLTEHSLVTMPSRCDIVFQLDNQRIIQQVKGALCTRG